MSCLRLYYDVTTKAYKENMSTLLHQIIGSLTESSYINLFFIKNASIRFIRRNFKVTINITTHLFFTNTFFRQSIIMNVCSDFTSMRVCSGLKSDSHLPKKFLFICIIESHLKMMKNAFYFILKALFVLKIFKYLS